MEAPKFMETPLVVWVQTFSPTHDPAGYEDLISGVFLNDVLKQIDPGSNIEQVATPSNTKERIENFDNLMKNLKTYYQDVLQQYIVMRIPNILKITKQPETDEAKNEITKLLLLLLGCAVQCERKEEFIENIKSLDLIVQQDIVEYIKEITEESKSVFAVDIPYEQLDEVTHNVVGHLKSLVEERDGYMDEIKELSQNLEELYQAQADEQKASSAPTPAPEAVTPDKAHHVGVELAETKAKLRRVRQELEEKSEQCIELQEDLDHNKSEVARLRNENLDLTQDARSARTYRDELDILKEKASRVEKYEHEVTKMKEKLNELDFFKSRVDELREDNTLLVETKNLLEDQLSSSQKRVETVLELESDLMKYRQQVQEMAKERDHDRLKMQELAEEKARLEFEMKTSFSESANLEDELQRARDQLRTGSSKNLEGQLHETSNTKILRLELENQKLQRLLAESKENAVLENTAKIVELEKENSRLAKKVDILHEAQTKESESFIELEQAHQNLTREKEDLKQTIEIIKESSDRQVKELERENEHLQQTVETLRQRNEQTHDLRVKDTERENERLTEKNKSLESQISKLDFDFRQAQKATIRLKDSVERIRELEDENQKLDKEMNDLHKKVATLQITCDNYDSIEQEATDLQIENEKLQKVVSNQKSIQARVEATEQDNINLTVENQRLQKSLEMAKTATTKIADLENEKDLLEREINFVRKSMETLKESQSNHDKLHVDLTEISNENEKLKRQLENTKSKLCQMEQDNSELDSQNEKLNHNIENMKISLRKMEEFEREARNFEVENADLQKSKSTLEKENKRIKQLIETKDTAVDELSVKLNEAVRENKKLQRSIEKQQDSCEKLEEVEQQNIEMVEQVHMDKKTISTLREELVNEKIRTQELSNNLEKLRTDLERIGLDREELLSADPDQGTRFEALENMMQKTYKESMEIKDSKIHSLESRLEESKKINFKLQSELKMVTRDHEALQQRREEEETLVNTAQRDRSVIHKIVPNHTKEILELKDHLITVERNNATLEAENKNMKYNQTSLQNRIDQMESQQSKLQLELGSLRTQHSSIQSQHAKLQVEYTTISSQNSTLTSQNANLHKQLNQLDNEHKKLVSQYEKTQDSHSELTRDFTNLQRLHDELTKGYEELISQHGSLKANYKVAQTEIKDAKERSMDLMRERDKILVIQNSLQKQHDKDSMGALQADYFKVKEDYSRLRNANENLNKDYRDLIVEHKNLKTEYNQLQLNYKDLQDRFNENRNHLGTMEVEYTKLATRYENAEGTIFKQEEEIRALMIQLESMNGQNQEFIMKALDDKTLAHENERAYMEKLSDLRRQKEKLEEKIMDQYKRMENSKKKKGFMRRAKDLISGKSKSRSDLSASMYVGPSPENSSVGSGSGDSFKKDKYRRQSAMATLATPQLSANQRTRSTNALNLLSNKPTEGALSLRSAKSSENLGHGEDDSVDSNNDDSWVSRPGKRRVLMDPDRSAYSHGNQNSISSDEASHRENHSRESSEDKPRPKFIPNPMLRPRSAIIGEDEPIGEKISLLQFLKEADRSPKSRRKLIKSKKVDLSKSENDLTKLTESVEEVPLNPKSPLIEPDEDEGEGKTRRLTGGDTTAPPFSDLNASNASHLSSGSSLGSYGDRTNTGFNNTSAYSTPPHVSHDINTAKTSTPNGKAGFDAYRRRSQGLDNEHAAMLRESVSKFNQKQGGSSSVGGRLDESYINRTRPMSAHDTSTNHKPLSEYNSSSVLTPPRSVAPSRKLPESPVITSALLRTKQSATPQQPCRPMSAGPSAFSFNNSSLTLPRHTPSNNNNTYTTPLKSNDLDLPDRSQIRARISSGVGTNGGPQQRSSSVRNLIQNFNNETNQVKSNDVPDLPPRRTRPVTPGPDITFSNRLSTNNESGNTASTRYRPMTPGATTEQTLAMRSAFNNQQRTNGVTPDSLTPRTTGNRVLPPTPGEQPALSGSSPARPGNPSQAGNPPQPGNPPQGTTKRSIWYEYGCV